ncbi:MAG: hypothetical protein JW940_39255 [Polyangiaceae bacterium]|nr:hypothetical protein [Polyangiaceae bacterium]
MLPRTAPAPGGFAAPPHEFGWRWIETLRGEYHWDHCDTPVIEAVANSVGVLALITATPEWASARAPGTAKKRQHVHSGVGWMTALSPQSAKENPTKTSSSPPQPGR